MRQCHEFVHACTAHLRLPFWLNEGIAMRAVDHMAGYPTVLEETRSIVRFDKSVLSSRSYRRLRPSDYDKLIQLYATGYWVTRRLEKENIAILRDLLKRKRPAREITRIIGNARLQQHGVRDTIIPGTTSLISAFFNG